MIFHILVIQRMIPLRDLLCSYSVLCCWMCLLPVIYIVSQQLSPSQSLSSEYWMSVSMALANFSLFCIELCLSPLAGFLVESPLHSDGLCTLQFLRYFLLVSLLHLFHAVSCQVLILGSLSLGFMFLFSQIGFSLEYLPCVILRLDSFTL